MPNYVRWREHGASYFFTVVTCQRRPLFAESPARRLLRRAMVEVRRKWRFDMFACVLLPDHLPCLWTLPDDDDDFPIRWANIKRLFSGRVALLSDGAAIDGNCVPLLCQQWLDHQPHSQSSG